MFSLLASLSVNIANPTWELPYGTENEKSVLAYIQNVTKINNRDALATILGSIKQESNFHPDICEGGARGDEDPDLAEMAAAQDKRCQEEFAVRTGRRRGPCAARGH